MKRAISVSLGSSTRDKRVEIELLGEKVIIERIGTDGDLEKAAQVYAELDGKVDAFGIGGAKLGLAVDDKWYPLHAVKPMVRYIKKTPLVGGEGLKFTLEYRAILKALEQIGAEIDPKRVLCASATDRWGMSKAFYDAGFECIFGDFMFALGLPIPIRTLKGAKRLAALLMPILGYLPMSMLYPTGEKQEENKPQHTKFFQWASAVAGDCLFIKVNMPLDMRDKVLFTNTTTEADVAFFKERGVKYLVTTTPVLAGRSFGTNMMEAALVAVSGKGRALTHGEYSELIDKVGFEPQIQKLN